MTYKEFNELDEENKIFYFNALEKLMKIYRDNIEGYIMSSTFQKIVKIIQAKNHGDIKKVEELLNE